MLRGYPFTRILGFFLAFLINLIAAEMSEKSHSNRQFFCGFTSGIMQAVAFNPYDRALYLSVKVFLNNLFSVVVRIVYFVKHLYN